MTKPERDPREAVLEALLDREADGALLDPDNCLAQLNAADPIRQVWPEVVGALETAARNLETIARARRTGEYMGDITEIQEYAENRATAARAALAKAREIAHSNELSTRGNLTGRKEADQP